MIKVAHISTGLYTGGAEVQLMRLLAKMDKTKFRMMVISLDGDSYLADCIRNMEIPVHSLALKQNPWRIWKGIQLLRAFDPDVIHGTMYEGGMFGCLFNRFFRKRPATILTVHEGLDNYHKESLRKRIQLKIWAWLSMLPDVLMYVSEVNRQQHAKWGFNNQHSVVIPNGVDSSRFSPYQDAGKRIRAELDIAEDTFVIGHTARYHLQKNHKGFIKAAATLLKNHPDVQFVMVGKDVDNNNIEITTQIHSLGIADNMHLLGEREDIPAIVNSYNIACLSSLSEAFPLSLGEAMVSNVPCVATDVGDVRVIIGKTGLVVPVDHDDALALALQKMVEMDKGRLSELGQEARQRCLDHFTLEQQVKAHEDLYLKLYEENPLCLENSKLQTQI